MKGQSMQKGGDFRPRGLASKQSKKERGVRTSLRNRQEEGKSSGMGEIKEWGEKTLMDDIDSK